MIILREKEFGNKANKAKRKAWELSQSKKLIEDNPELHLDLNGNRDMGKVVSDFRKLNNQQDIPEKDRILKLQSLKKKQDKINKIRKEHKVGAFIHDTKKWINNNPGKVVAGLGLATIGAGYGGYKLYKKHKKENK